MEAPVAGEEMLSSQSVRAFAIAKRPLLGLKLLLCVEQPCKCALQRTVTASPTPIFQRLHTLLPVKLNAASRPVWQWQMPSPTGLITFLHPQLLALPLSLPAQLALPASPPRCHGRRNSNFNPNRGRATDHRSVPNAQRPRPSLPQPQRAVDSSWKLEHA